MMGGGGDMSAGVLGSVGGSGDASVPRRREAHEVGGSGADVISSGLGSSNEKYSGDGDVRGRGDESGGACAGNRWPRQETLALLEIRSGMEAVFRDASVKAPLWEEVSRKMAELRYHRSAKKCREKFENVYKYHKRTKDGRTAKNDRKNYRFSDQLQVLEHQHPPTTVTTSAAVNHPPSNLPQLPVPSTMSQNTSTVPSFQSTDPQLIPPSQPPATDVSSSFPSISADLISASSSSTSSDVELARRRKRKRKWDDFFERLMKEVMEKQDEMQKKFLETIEQRERERTARDEAWRAQESTRINREIQILAQERSVAAAKDAAVLSFLQKISQHQNPGSAMPPKPTTIVTTPAPPPALAATPPQTAATNVDTIRSDDIRDQTLTPASSSRWPKEEIEALINLRTNLDTKYHETGPKGPLWEEISAAMRKLGYNRNARRCKEKWENINKYFKKVKESNKKRHDDSKTCPYFQQLEALYKEKNKADRGASSSVPLLVRPEQPWPLSQKAVLDRDPTRAGTAMEDIGSEQMDRSQEVEEEEEEEEDEEECGFKIVASKPVSMGSGKETNGF